MGYHSGRSFQPYTRTRDRDKDDKKRGPRFKKKVFHRRKVCRFCAEHINSVDYKDMQTLRYFVSDRGKINPRRINGNCAKHQRLINQAILRARTMALIPYTAMIPSSNNPTQG
ncbi:MAG: 30S ribosomal protein S18 [Deltaproteobacteria bacterium]|jgi:small subunit ribosomal protein S18|nr:30S ribosomal protein S18 [Deltaproteobacteria bacterium]